MICLCGIYPLAIILEDLKKVLALLCENAGGAWQLQLISVQDKVCIYTLDIILKIKLSCHGTLQFPEAKIKFKYICTLSEP